MDRRRFVAGASAMALVGTRGSVAATQVRDDKSVAKPAVVDVVVTVNGVAGVTMPKDFVGLSYESAQLANAEYFSAGNVDLVKKFKALSGDGVLRLGGHLSNLTIWDDGQRETLTEAQEKAIAGGADAYEWLTVDAVGGKAKRGVLTPLAIRKLRGFLDATGWRVIYGLNPQTGSAERAEREAKFVAEAMGEKLVAFQVGNEPDRFRVAKTKEYNTFEEWWAVYEAFVKAVRKTVPGARFAGPDTTRRAVDWEIAYAEHAKGDAVLVTSHYYDVGAQEGLATDTERLLKADDKLVSVDVAKAMEAAKIAGVPYRMSEGNSCSHGGEAGLSDAYASALWGADYMLLVGQAGFAGVNLHGGGMGRYSPIVGEVATGFEARPLYFGMQMASLFAGGTFLGAKVEAGGLNLTAYAGRKSGRMLVAVVNKDARVARVVMEGKVRRKWELKGEGLNSGVGVRFGEVGVGKELVVEGYSGVVVEV
jgi:hypothetical protein